MKNFEHKLDYQNNWESDSYYVDGKMIEKLKKVSIDGKEYDVTGRTVEVPYNDMGHTYTAISTHYFITETVFGMDHEFDLNTVVPNVEVIPLKFKFVKGAGQ